LKLIAGLGNPGPRYKGTRHNLGFDVLDELARRHQLSFDSSPTAALAARWRDAPGGDQALLVKPLTFVNLSGQAVGELVRYYRVDLTGILVIVDDVALELGRLRARAGGSAGGHNGLKSVAEHLGTEAYARLRIGVGAPAAAGESGARRDLADHVLARFAPDERPIVNETIVRAADAVETFLASGIGVVMNRYNRKENGNDTDTES
jgi:PTH1 family peptidyl-tRNA hydrolase